MKTVALATFLSLGLSVPALAQTTNGQDMALALAQGGVLRRGDVQPLGHFAAFVLGMPRIVSAASVMAS